jgi:hypothetical protein
MSSICWDQWIINALINAICNRVRKWRHNFRDHFFHEYGSRETRLWSTYTNQCWLMYYQCTQANCTYHHWPLTGHEIAIKTNVTQTRVTTTKNITMTTTSSKSCCFYNIRSITHCEYSLTVSILSKILPEFAGYNTVLILSQKGENRAKNISIWITWLKFFISIQTNRFRKITYVVQISNATFRRR